MHERPAEVRRRGVIIEVPDLRQKIDLLVGTQSNADMSSRPPFGKQGAVAAALGWNDGAPLAKAIASNQISSSKVPALLRLFGIHQVRDWIVPETPQDRFWMALLQEPFDAFCARICLAGGDCFAGDVGSTWDRFLGVQRRRWRTTAPGAKPLRIVARSIEGWQNIARSSGSDRLWPPGAPDPAEAYPTRMPLLHVGDLVRVYLDTRTAPLERAATQFGAYVFLFHDVVIRQRRSILPLVPFPPGSQLVMPGERIEGGLNGDPVLQIPVPRGEHQFLTVPQKWGSIRTMVAVVTDRPLDDEVLEDARSQHEIRLERLDLLAARLSNEAQWQQRNYAVFDVQYAVDEGSKESQDLNS